ncbi:hypothetical protein EJ03DRAFT_331876, partial [Teratosphaeria nubilosa]
MTPTNGLAFFFLLVPWTATLVQAASIGCDQYAFVCANCFTTGSESGYCHTDSTSSTGFTCMAARDEKNQYHPNCQGKD